MEIIDPIDPSIESGLDMWTVYDHPSDFPDKFVARLFRLTDAVVPTTAHIVSDDVDKIRAFLLEKRLVCLKRSEFDEPHIIEVWL